MKLFKKISALVIVLALVLSFAGCTDHTWSAKTSDTKLPAGIYIYYMMSAYNDAVGKLDEDADVFNSEIEEQSAESWILDKAKEYEMRHFAVDKICKDMEIYDLTDEENSSINTNLTYMYYYYGYGDLYTEAGVSMDSVRTIFENSTRYSNLLLKLYGEGGEKEIAEEELEKYFEENYIGYKVLTASFSTTDSSGNTVKYSDEDVEKLTKLIETYYDEATSSEETIDIEEFNKRFANRFNEETEEEEAEEAEVAEEAETAEEATTATPEALKIQYVTEDTSTSYGDDFFDNIKGTEIGGYIKIVTDSAAYLIQRVYEKPSESETYKDSKDACIAGVAEDDFNDYLLAQAKEMNIVFNDKALSEYKLSKIVALLSE